MVKIKGVSEESLNEAVKVWTGWGVSDFPRRDDNRLRLMIGDELAIQLLPVIKKLEDEFYSSNAQFISQNIQEMEKKSFEDFKEIHPEISDEIAKVFAWCYTFDFK